MKKFLIVSSLALLSALTTQAQTDVGAGVNSALRKQSNYGLYSKTDSTYLAGIRQGTILVPGAGLSRQVTDLLYKPLDYVPSWLDITGRPIIFSGSYLDLTNRPTIPTVPGWIPATNPGYQTELQVSSAITNLTAPLLNLKLDLAAYNANRAADVNRANQIGTQPASTITGLAAVATSGNYLDLTNKPTFSAGVTSYTALTDKPTLFSGSYLDLTNRPSLFSGAYADLTGKPTIPTVPSALSSFTNDLGYQTAGQVQTFGDGRYRLQSAAIDYNTLLNKPTIPTGVTSYTALTDKPTLFSGAYADLTGKPLTFAASPHTHLASDITLDATHRFVTDTQIANWNAQAGAGFSGNYNDLINKPTLFSGAYTDLSGKPTLFSGAYSDLTGKPTIPVVPTNVSSFTNDAGYQTAGQVQTAGDARYRLQSAAIDYSTLTGKPVLFSGAYTDLTGKPTIPTVPTNVSSFTNDAGYQTVGQVNAAIGAAPFVPTARTITINGITQDLTANRSWSITAGSSTSGLNGTNGLNAFGATTANFSQPATGANVTVSVDNASWAGTGQIVYIPTGGYYSVSSVVSATALSLMNLGYSNNATSGIVIASGSRVTPGGLIGQTGATGATGATGPAGSGGSGGSGPTYVVTTTSAAAVQAAINSVTALTGGYITLTPGTYDLTNVTINIGGKSNLTLKANKDVFFTSSATNNHILFNGDNSNIALDGINFVCTASSGGGSGLILFNEQGAQTGVEIKNCTMASPNARMNAITGSVYSVAANGGSGNGKLLQRVNIHNNQIGPMGRMGVELVNHTWDDSKTTVYIKNVMIHDNLFFDLGRVAEADGTTFNGMAFSNSGYANDIKISDNEIVDPKLLGIELAGSDGGIIANNTIRGVNNVFNAISVSDNSHNATKNIVVSGNAVDNAKGQCLAMNQVKEFTVSGNSFKQQTTTNAAQNTVYFQNCTGGVFIGCIVNGCTNNPVRLDDSSQMVINELRITSTNTFAPISIFGSSGAGSLNNQVGSTISFVKSSGYATSGVVELIGTTTGTTGNR